MVSPPLWPIIYCWAVHDLKGPHGRDGRGQRPLLVQFAPFSDVEAAAVGLAACLYAPLLLSPLFSSSLFLRFQTRNCIFLISFSSY